MRFSFTTSNCTCNLTLRGVHATIVAVKKQKSTTYSECELVALGIQHAMRMRRVIQGATQKFLDKCYKTQITSYMDMIYFYSSKYIPP